MEENRKQLNWIEVKVEHFAKEVKALEKAKECEQQRNEEQLKSHKREIGRKEEIMLKAAEEFKIEISKKEKPATRFKKKKLTWKIYRKNTSRNGRPSTKTKNKKMPICSN